MNALLASKACDLTGIVVFVCARHGCFVPNALVDLFKGEQQKNVDFALLKALETLHVDPDQGIMVLYDIVCQWIIHLLHRIGHLLPPNLEIDRAIDLFHVHAHKDQCFFRYATTFIPGAGVVAGQILESLWSTLNSISPTVRTATLPHRAEMLDDHTCDSNHKKLLAMSETLCHRHLEAQAMMRDADQYYLDITGTADDQNLFSWTKEIEAAESSRLSNVEVMDIYGARVKDVMSEDNYVVGKGSAMESAGLSRARQQEPVSLPARASASTAAIEEWIEFALVVEEKQCVQSFMLMKSAGLMQSAGEELTSRIKFATLPQTHWKAIGTLLSSKDKPWRQCL